MLHKLIDTLSGVEVISDDKWLPIYQSRKEIKYIGPHEVTPDVTVETVVTPTKSKKSKK